MWRPDSECTAHETTRVEFSTGWSIMTTEYKNVSGFSKRKWSTHTHAGWENHRSQYSIVNCLSFSKMSEGTIAPCCRQCICSIPSRLKRQEISGMFVGYTYACKKNVPWCSILPALPKIVKRKVLNRVAHLSNRLSNCTSAHDEMSDRPQIFHHQWFMGFGMNGQIIPLV